ncbi:hypothetical protein CI109_105565 [Kwoniella shandongensis]|uniref:Uncharacterized protein n=1 Tax=Kwoniella shandongensis TaxID=1734106 RepID=A0A5M6C2N1_9TREE|nr:uncharacterized protein CI109_002281 [Kwoniella shandongensis]KAA5529388.1 hypothetical protein CI109_002281 [Kwoniella shandongensis]
MPKQNPQASLNHTLVAMPTREQSDRAEALLSLSISLVDSAVDILRDHIQSDDQLIQASLLMPGGTLGKHFRHVIESFRAFLLPLYPSSSSTSEINYDAILPSARKPIARSVKACQVAMESVRDDLIAWGDLCRSRSLSSGSASEVASGVAGQVGVSREQGGLASEMDKQVKVLAITPTRQEMGSTVGRELWYCSLHAIHHFSMLRTIAVHELGLELPVEFGTAPSTLLYRGLSWKPPTEKETGVKSKL